MQPNLAYDEFGWDQVDPFDERDAHLWMKIEHLGRYLFAADFLKQYQPNIIMDISCGIGYGVVELNRIAKGVIGVDSSQEILEIAYERCKNCNAKFLHKDLDLDDLIPEVKIESVDAIISFETVEHLVDANRAISQFCQILRPGGFFICSVPNVLSESRDSAGLPRNKYHKQWFNFGSLSKIVQNHGLQVVYRLGQSWSYILSKREQQLSKAKIIKRRLSNEPCLHSPEMIRMLSYIIAYPTVEDVDGSYSIIIVAQKTPI
jgi:ubiquinone/menaquinone biosynthesis C-methylase UbiE